MRQKIYTILGWFVSILYMAGWVTGALQVYYTSEGEFPPALVTVSCQFLIMGATLLFSKGNKFWATPVSMFFFPFMMLLATVVTEGDYTDVLVVTVGTLIAALSVFCLFRAGITDKNSKIKS